MAKSDRYVIDPKPLTDLIADQSRKGVACPECDTLATVEGGEGRAVVPFPNGFGGIVFYVICNSCGLNYEKYGRAGLPNLWADSRTTPLMSK